MTPPIEPSESLTLDTDARDRATAALQEAFEYGHRSHWCAEWDDGDGCELCWENAAAVIRAAEGLRKCKRCNGRGTVGPEGDCCPECGGNGLEQLNLDEHEVEAPQ